MRSMVWGQYSWPVSVQHVPAETLNMLAVLSKPNTHLGSSQHAHAPFPSYSLFCVQIRGAPQEEGLGAGG